MSNLSWDEDLVEKLGELAKPESIDRAALAHLRRGLDRPADYTLSRVGWLFRRVPDKPVKVVDNAVLAAGLFAWVKGSCPHTPGVNFGDAFGKGPSELKEQRQKRFIDLLDTDEAELPFKLRQAITLIEGQDLDWVLFLKHLNNWNDPDRWVQKQWARGFWSAEKEAEPELESATVN